MPQRLVHEQEILHFEPEPIWYDAWIGHNPQSALSIKYRLMREDGVEIDVTGALWEAVLERAYRNGWRPAGTGAPWAPDAITPRIATIDDPHGQKPARWRESDYFSASRQHVYAADALALGIAVLRGIPRRKAESVPSDTRRESELSRVGSFARIGGFVIGRAPPRELPVDIDQP